MDWSQVLNPSLLMTVFVAIVGFVVWLVRLEGKVSNATNTNEQQQKTIDKLAGELEHHRFNDEVHFNRRITQEVEKSYDRRFGAIEKQLGEISTKLDKIAQKQ
jgi:predicted HicB family RNase H-like nuclease